MTQNVVSNGIYFIIEGSVEVCYKDSLDSIITLRKGSYFGEISYLFKTLNQFYFENKKDSNGLQTTIFCLKDESVN